MCELLIMRKQMWRMVVCQMCKITRAVNLARLPFIKMGVSTRVRKVREAIKLIYHTYCHLINNKRIIVTAFSAFAADSSFVSCRISFFVMRNTLQHRFSISMSIPSSVPPPSPSSNCGTTWSERTHSLTGPHHPEQVSPVCSLNRICIYLFH